MAFKMKAGEEGPMKKNFGSALNITEAQEKKLNPGLVAAIKKSEGKSPNEMNKDNAPMMRMDPSAMKAMGKPAPVKAMDKSPMKDNGEKATQYLMNKVTIKKNRQPVDKKAFEKLKRNKLQVNLDKKRKLDYIPQTQKNKDESEKKFTRTLTSNIRTKK